MSFVNAPLPHERLGIEMELVAANLMWFVERYPVQPMGRASLVIPRPEVKIKEETEEKHFALITGSGRWARVPYRRAVGGNLISRTRLRTPTLTPATAPPHFEPEDTPWAVQSGISLAADEMVTWVLMKRMKGLNVSYDPERRQLSSQGEMRLLSDFGGGPLGAHCYPTEGHFTHDVCAYLNRWFSAETEVDGELDGDEVRLDAVLTCKKTGFRLGVEFKHPHILSGSILNGFKQAASYRHATWGRHGKLPIALCCPGRVPDGREIRFAQRRFGVGVLDLKNGLWQIDHRDFTWKEPA